MPELPGKPAGNNHTHNLSQKIKILVHQLSCGAAAVAGVIWGLAGGGKRRAGAGSRREEGVAVGVKVDPII